MRDDEETRGIYRLNLSDAQMDFDCIRMDLAGPTGIFQAAFLYDEMTGELLQQARHNPETGTLDPVPFQCMDVIHVKTAATGERCQCGAVTFSDEDED